MFKHGIITSEKPTPIVGMTASQVQVIVGTAPVNLSSEDDVVNRPFLCHSFADAEKVLGYNKDYENFTLCEAMDVNFSIVGIGPVVFINVLDPTKHKKEVVDEAVAMVNGIFTSTKETIIMSSVVVKSSDGATTYVKDTDYSISMNAINKLQISKIDGGSISDNNLKITYSEIDPSIVTTSDIIGAFDQGTGKRTGLELMRLIYPSLQVIANRIVIPKYSGEEDVKTAMIAMSNDMNGCFDSSLMFDLKGLKSTEALADKEGSSNNVAQGICVWPKVKVNNKNIHLSTLWSAMIARTTAMNNDFPGKHSNIKIPVQGIVNSAGNDVFMDLEEGNALNEKGIVTVINMNGMRLWGNYTAQYPNVEDPKDKYISVKQTFIHEQNRFITEYFDKVDDPLSPKMIESLVDEENIRYNALKAQGKIGDGRTIFNLSENTSAMIEERGSLLLRQVLSPFLPGQAIENEFTFSPYELGGGAVG